MKWGDIGAFGVGVASGLLLARWAIRKRHRFRISFTVEHEGGEDATRKR